jgi:hypothetical protein
MPQIFRSSSNKLSLFSLIALFVTLILVAASAYGYFKSSYHTDVGVIREQVIPFSHKHHVQGLGLDCRFCHNAVEKSNTAGMPTTELCLGCHAEIYRDSPILRPLHESLKKDHPLKWTRVHNLPDHVYFNHSIHIKKNVSCEACHGDVGSMPLVSKQRPLTMMWCLECHKHASETEDLTTCTTCHR